MFTSDNHGLLFAQVANQMVFFVPRRHSFSFILDPLHRDVYIIMSIIELVVVSIDGPGKRDHFGKYSIITVPNWNPKDSPY